MKILELFAGIGGVAEAIKLLPNWSVVEAIDIDRTAEAVYRRNHPGCYRIATLESVTDLPAADLWWMSPPCQPYTRRGRGAGAEDPRSAALSHLINRVQRVRPPRIALENVPEFENCEHHRRLVDDLIQGGYDVQTTLACPTDWGVPMRRRRFYLWADRMAKTQPVTPPCGQMQPLKGFVDSQPDPALNADEIARRYAGAIDTVRVDNPAAAGATACFTSAYGKSPVRAGSYLVEEAGTRRFSPAEITRLMGFSEAFDWGEASTRTRYRLIGNSVAVPVVRALLAEGFATVG